MMSFFNFGKRAKESKGGCCCGAGCTPEAMREVEIKKCAGGIKVLGSGCAKCHTLATNTRDALKELGINEEVELVTDFATIASYGVMSTPALVIDNKVVSYGKVLKRDEVIKMIKGARGL